MKAKYPLTTSFTQEEYQELIQEVDKMGLSWNKCIMIWMRYWRDSKCSCNKKE